MGTRRQQPTSQPANPQAETPNQPLNPEPQTGTLQDASLQDNKGAVNASTASSEPTSNQDLKEPENEPEALPTELDSFLGLLKFSLDNSTDPDEQEALKQLIQIVEAYPEQEKGFIELMVQQMGVQFRAYREMLEAPEAVVAGLFPLATVDTEADEDDERAKRLRQNAQSELDQLKEESKKRQQEAEALQAKSQPDRREAIKEA